MSVLSLAGITLFPLLMMYAAFSDLFTMTISNVVSLVLVGGFVALSLAAHMDVQTLVVMHLGAGLAVLVLTFVFFAFNWIGGGDAKLAAATAVWLGWSNLAAYGLLASMLGAGLTIGILLARKHPLPRPLLGRPWISRLHAKDNGVPYGIALAIAGLYIYPDSVVWQALAS